MTVATAGLAPVSPSNLRIFPVGSTFVVGTYAGKAKPSYQRSSSVTSCFRLVASSSTMFMTSTEPSAAPQMLP